MEDLMRVRRRVTAALPPGVRRRLRHMAGRVSPWEPGAELTAPPAPPGTTCAPPDFVGVGAQKAGTSWWFAMLLRHPEMYRVPGVHKELHWFSRFWDRDMTAEDIAAYHRWFPRPDGRRTGEWTPIYMAQHWTPGLLARAAPDAKVLVLLRDPVERYRSGITHHVRRGDNDARIAVDAFARGLYAGQVRSLLTHFAREQVLVLQYERCRRDTRGQFSRTLEFLGVDPSFTPDFEREVNATRGGKLELPAGRHEELAEQYADDVRRLVDMDLDIDPELWPGVASRL